QRTGHHCLTRNVPALDPRGTPNDQTAATDRPRTSDELRQLILRLARDTGWSAERIHGELKKLGLASICESTVRNILRAEGIEPVPQRSLGTWSQFVQ